MLCRTRTRLVQDHIDGTAYLRASFSPNLWRLAPRHSVSPKGEGGIILRLARARERSQRKEAQTRDNLTLWQ